jgi:uncharacterized protein
MVHPEGEAHMAITDLFRPKWKHSDAAVRKPAVEKLTDEGILSDIAQSDPDRGVRLAAVAKLSDPHGLARILHKESEVSVWQAALARISDQTLLAEIARTTPRATVRAAVVKKLMSPSVLAERLKGDDDAAVRLAALEKVSDQAAVAGTARSDKDPAVRAAAVKKITADAILAELLTAEKDAGIRTAILDQMKDHTILGKIAQQHPVSEVRTAASKKLAELLRATIMLGDSATAISLLGIPGDHYIDPDDDGWTPLHCAAFKGDLEVVELLLDKGAPPDTRDNKNKWTALHYAAAHGHSRLIAPLIKAGADPNAVSGPDRNTPLHVAAAGLPKGFSASPRTRPDVPSDAAFRKQAQSHPDVASELLRHGADPHRGCRQGYLPLQVAAERGDIPYGEALLAGGADLNKRGAQESTALHWAAAKKNAAFGKWLVDKGAQPDLADALGWTPLFLADANGTSDLVPVLLAAGARTEATINGKKVSFRAARVAAVSPAAGTDHDEELIEACEAGSLAAAKAAISAGANVNCTSRDGWTPLLTASKAYPKIVELLLAKGANPNIASDQGYTPLMRAAGNGAETIVRQLLAAGSDKRLLDWKGKTAYQLSMEVGQRACAQLVR